MCVLCCDSQTVDFLKQEQPTKYGLIFWQNALFQGKSPEDTKKIKQGLKNIRKKLQNNDSVSSVSIHEISDFIAPSHVL